MVLLDSPQAHCQMTAVSISGDSPALRVGPWRKYRPLNYIQILQKDMETRAKTWKRYQRQQQKKGKSSDDWELPVVRLAYVKAISETESPYLYDHSCHKQVRYDE